MRHTFAYDAAESRVIRSPLVTLLVVGVLGMAGTAWAQGAPADCLVEAPAEPVNGCTAIRPGAGYTSCSYTASGPARWNAAVLGSAVYDIRVDGSIVFSSSQSASGTVSTAPGQVVNVSISCDYDHDGYCARLGVAVVSIGDE